MALSPTSAHGSGSSGTQGSEIGYDQITAPVTVTSAVEATGTTIITASAYTFDGAAVIMEFFSPSVRPAASDNVGLSLFEGATELGLFAIVNTGAGTQNCPVLAHYRFTPTAGSHTYKVTAYRGAANGTVNAGPGGVAQYPPAFIRFTKV